MYDWQVTQLKFLAMANFLLNWEMLIHELLKEWEKKKKSMYSLTTSNYFGAGKSRFISNTKLLTHSNKCPIHVLLI